MHVKSNCAKNTNDAVKLVRIDAKRPTTTEDQELNPQIIFVKSEHSQSQPPTVPWF